MLDMGFEQDMERILGSIPTGQERQTLLFSATLPKWVKSVAKRCEARDGRVSGAIGGCARDASWRAHGSKVLAGGRDISMGGVWPGACVNGGLSHGLAALLAAYMPLFLVCRPACRYQRDPQTIDLVGEENTGKLADTIRLMVQQVGARRMLFVGREDWATKILHPLGIG